MPGQQSHSGDVAAWPRPPTPFLGRRQELADVCRRLSQPGCRLLTLCGEGGIGKTRLALEVGARWGDDGGRVVFVDLQPVPSADFLVAAIADALNLAQASPDDPRAHLFHTLRDKALLLVLDNFEHLLEGVDLLSDLLRAAPRVKVLVTSRFVLNLQEEWLYPVGGLPFPAAADDDFDRYDAVRLFVAGVQRVRPDFQPEAERNDVVRVCRLVAGMPLALELAAAWAKTLPIAAIGAEIERDLAFLATPLHNVPAKHGSMQAVFRRSWQLLSGREQEALRRLSVFRGRFGREAAATVAGASLPILAALVDKSLLRWQQDGRYHVHELLRQFAAGQLAGAPETLAHTRDLHAAYYSRFVGDRFGDLTGERQQAALAEIAAELDNVRAAWQWAASQRRSADLEYAAMGLHTFYQYRGRFREGADAFAAAVAAVAEASPAPERDRALAVLLTCAGWLAMRFGRVEEATAMQARALSIYEALNRLPAPGQGTDPLTALSLLAATRGDYEQALALGDRAWQRASARADKKNMAFARYGLASAALAQGNYEAAHGHAQVALALARAEGNRWFMAYVYNHLGQISQALANRAAAAEYYQASYTVKEELDDPEGMALALCHQGDVALEEGAYQQAHALYQQSAALYQELGDRGGFVRTCHGLGVACQRLGNVATARQHLECALEVAAAAEVAPLTLSLLASVGLFLLDNGRRRRGLATLAFVAGHPASDRATRDRAQAVLGRLGAAEAAMSWPTGDRPDAATDLDTVITTLLAELAIPVTPAAGSAAGDTIIQPSQPLIEALSERELEVLQLIAAGLKNREIAAELTVALSTVKTHVNNIYGKLSVANRAQAVARAHELNLLGQ